MITGERQRALGHALRNVVSSRLSGKGTRLYYVVEAADWSIRWDGLYICDAVKRASGIKCGITLSARGIVNQVVHFGSRNLMMPSREPPRLASVHPSNRVVLTWFHGDPESSDPQEHRFRDLLPSAIERADLIVASSEVGATRLRRAGAPPSKLRVIPLGVDVERFRPATPAVRDSMRTELGIPEGAICIGSFQKDGEGWGRGSKPKLIKGPDVFADVIGKIAADFPVHVLLTGPARGYARGRLGAFGVEYTHHFLDDYFDIARYYQCLDIYLVASRDEGGPKAVLESMASGIPLVTTRVGMAEDVVVDGENGLLADIGDVDALSSAIGRLIEDVELQKKLALAGRQTAEGYTWDMIGMRYAEEVYRPLMSDGR